MNYSDAERIAAILDSFGLSKTTEEKDADFFIVIACSVRQHAIDRIYGKVKDLKEHKGLTTILSGCLLETDRKKLKQHFDLIFDINDVNKLALFLESELKTKREEAKIEEYLSIIPKYDSKIRAFVPISTGCNNYCSYCAVPYTRGQEKSRSSEDIVQEVKNLVAGGCKEITLLGQNVNSYGHDLGTNESFKDLILRLDQIPGTYRVYFYSNHPKDMSEDLIQTISHLKHFPAYIHLPLQSGSNEIIRAMNRHYTKEHYLELVKEIRRAMPNVTLTTDIIVGFPGETIEHFKETIKVMEQAEFDMAFIAQYSPRPGTKAAKLSDNVSKDEKKEREEILQKILAKSAKKQNEKFLDQTLTALFDETKGNRLYGRTEGFKVVETTTKDVNLVGDFAQVKITSITPWKLIGKIIQP
jgi:tRNA-2-methylthio-N6-dimethylallyladenosine synthase